MTRQRKVKVGKREVRSGFEASIVKQLIKSKVKFDYEKLKLKYIVPERNATYTPDFELKRSSIIIEAKGKFTGADRKKMLLVKQQNPELDIRMLFMRDQRIAKNSNTYYSTWCDKHEFKYAFKEVPIEWLNE